MPPRKASGSRQKGAQNALPIPPTYPGLIDEKGMTEPQWQACKDMLENVYKAKDGSRRMSDIFRELPDREDYEDYYQAIPEPECLDNISTQLGAQAYVNSEAFFKQLHLIFLNAKHYNEEESLLWADAKRLEDQIHNEWKTRAESGVFSNPDPYHSSAVKPGRKKRGGSSVPSKSATPLPEAKSTAMVERKATTPAPELPPIPEVKTAFPSPLDGPIQLPPHRIRIVATPIPAPRINVPAASPVPRAIPQPAVAPASPTASEQGRQKQAEKDRAVVAALDARLPRWPGPQPVLPGNSSIGGIPGYGWFGEGAPDHDRIAGGSSMWPHRIRAVVDAIEGYRDQNGQRLAEVLDILPAVADIPFLSFNSPVSFPAIQGLARANSYDTLRSFDMDMTRLFEKARRYFHEGSAEYGKILVLQRLYNALTAVYPMALPGSGIPFPSSTLFASLPAGPGNARSMHETAQDLKAGAAEDQVGYGITTFRVGTKDRHFTPEARHKGQAFKMGKLASQWDIADRTGDYVHLINPDDATRPIIGQIFKTFVPTKGYRTHHVTVCWYFRPEQTVHTPNKMFYEREVFKTGHFCDHPVEDILEKISVQFYVKYIRGRPRAGEFYPGWPSYVCHSRFNDREHLMVRIKNWNSCIPDFMSVISYSRNIEVPMVKSPFLKGVQGPGFFGEPKKAMAGDDDDEDEEERERERPKRRERTRKEVQPPHSVDTPIKHSPVPTYTPAPVPAPSPISTAGPSRVPATFPAPTPAPTPRPVQQPSQRSGPPQTNSPSSFVSHPFPNRTIAAVMGGSQALEQHAVKEPLPLDTARLFERDARGNVLWFSGPPLAPGTIPIPTQQPHSLEYLAYITKRKAGELGAAQKRARRSKASEMHHVDKGLDEGQTDNMWWAEGQSSDQVSASLKALIDTV
ncbi:uncharacterized protein I206_106627 [Kwoniella pini CBS 10737]|uniref:Chromatin structure-remodeling complex subunit RSC1/2 n=1 Tax=Kwoniella pini CBS 10737 TaxID=1296096 RepID=A0AAJ8LAZ8_9TREE